MFCLMVAGSHHRHPANSYYKKESLRWGDLQIAICCSVNYNYTVGCSLILKGSLAVEYCIAWPQIWCEDKSLAQSIACVQTTGLILEPGEANQFNWANCPIAVSKWEIKTINGLLPASFLHRQVNGARRETLALVPSLKTDLHWFIWSVSEVDEAARFRNGLITRSLRFADFAPKSKGVPSAWASLL